MATPTHPPEDHEMTIALAFLFALKTTALAFLLSPHKDWTLVVLSFFAAWGIYVLIIGSTT